jgi:hypothetical protein
MAMPCILLLWLARSGLYLGCEPARAAVASLVYCIVMMAGLVTVYLENGTPSTAGISQPASPL